MGRHFSQIELICHFCGGKYMIKKYRKNTSKYCSFSCNRKDHNPQAKHFGRSTRLYSSWCRMKQRCLNPAWWRFDRYGGRGIKICPEWINSFENFREWALKNGHADGLVLDRIHNDGNYEPGNCQWITNGENVRKMHRDRRAVAIFFADNREKYL